MKTKITPEYVLTMLKELKELVNQKRFMSTKFATKYPTYYVFQKFIYSKGLMKKVYNQEQWISIEPNIIMATELLKLYINYGKEVKERYNNKVVQKRQIKNTAMSLAKKIRREGEGWMDAVVRANEIMREQKTQNNNTEGDALPIQAFSDVFQKNKNIEAEQSINQSEIEANLKEQIIISQERFEIIEKKFFKLFDENKVLLEKNSCKNSELLDFKKRQSELIKKLEERQAYLIEKLKERQEVIDELLDREDVKKQSKKQEEVIFPSSETVFYRDLTSQEIMSSKPLTSKSTRTFKVLGIPIFTIDNK